MRHEDESLCMRIERKVKMELEKTITQENQDQCALYHDNGRVVLVPRAATAGEDLAQMYI